MASCSGLNIIWLLIRFRCSSWRLFSDVWLCSFWFLLWVSVTFSANLIKFIVIKYVAFCFHYLSRLLAVVWYVLKPQSYLSHLKKNNSEYFTIYIYYQFQFAQAISSWLYRKVGEQCLLRHRANVSVGQFGFLLQQWMFNTDNKS